MIILHIYLRKNSNNIWHKLNKKTLVLSNMHFGKTFTYFKLTLIYTGFPHLDLHGTWRCVNDSKFWFLTLHYTKLYHYFFGIVSLNLYLEYSGRKYRARSRSHSTTKEIKVKTQFVRGRKFRKTYSFCFSNLKVWQHFLNKALNETQKWEESSENVFVIIIFQSLLQFRKKWKLGVIFLKGGKYN